MGFEVLGQINVMGILNEAQTFFSLNHAFPHDDYLSFTIKAKCEVFKAL